MSPAVKKALDEAEKAVRSKARNGALKMKVGTPDRYGHGGNQSMTFKHFESASKYGSVSLYNTGSSDTANNARRFFAKKNRAHVVALFEPKTPEDEAKISETLKRLSVVLWVTGCRKKVGSSICFIWSLWMKIKFGLSLQFRSTSKPLRSIAG